VQYAIVSSQLSIRFQVSGFRFQVSGFRFQVFGFYFQVLKKDSGSKEHEKLLTAHCPLKPET
jgi:hypothetical protein